MSQPVKISKKMSFSAVPDSLFSLDLSPVAFKVVAWALGRPDGWVFFISHMIKTLNLSDKTWPRARRELIFAGFFVQQKFRGEGGKICWSNSFTDAPLWSIPQTIPPKSRDGDGKDAGGMNAEGGNKTDDLSKSNTAAAASQLMPEILQVPQPPCPPAEKTKTYILIQNTKDEIDRQLLVEEFGTDAVEAEARELKLEGKLLPWPSNILKRLISKRDAARQANLAASEAAAQQKTAALAAEVSAQKEKVWAHYQTLSPEQKMELETDFERQANSTIASKFRRDGLNSPLIKSQFLSWLMAVETS